MEWTHPHFNVNAARCDINMVEVENILSEVRSRLLDFALELKDALGDIPEGELPKKAQEVRADRMFTTAIYNTGGTVIVGSTNVQVNNQRAILKDCLKKSRSLDMNQEILKRFAKQCSMIRAKARHHRSRAVKRKSGIQTP